MTLDYAGWAWLVFKKQKYTTNLGEKAVQMKSGGNSVSGKE